MDKIKLLQAYCHGNFKVMALKCIVPPKVVPKNVRKVAIHSSVKAALGPCILFLLLDGNQNDTSCAGNARQHGFE